MALAATIRPDIKDQLDLQAEHTDVASDSSSERDGAKRIHMHEGIVYDVLTVRKNDSELTSSEYTWHQYSPFVTIDGGVTKGDFLYIEFQRWLDDNGIDAHITHVDNHLKGEFSPYYDPTEIENSPTYQALVKDWTIGRIAKRLVQGEALESAKFRDAVTRIDDAKQFARWVMKGGGKLLDSSLDELARVQGSLVGGPQNIDNVDDDWSDRDKILQNLRDEYDDNIVNFLAGIPRSQ
jgi:hypothetical protein